LKSQYVTQLPLSI